MRLRSVGQRQNLTLIVVSSGVEVDQSHRSIGIIDVLNEDRLSLIAVIRRT